MRRGAKPEKPGAARRPVSTESGKGEGASDRQLQKRLEEALEREAATAEILKIISSSPANLEPVFDAILARATRLCEAHLGVLQMREGESYRAVAEQGATPEFKAWLFEGPRRLDPTTGVGRALLAGRVVHIADITDDPAYRDRDPARVATVELGGARTFLTVPMLRAGEAIGTIAIYRPQVRPFTDKQIELVTTFADQAVIAVENVRLFTELQARNRDLSESLERQTATAEILRIISMSPADVQPTLDAIAASAVRLCDGLFGGVWRLDEGLIHLVAHHNFTPEGLSAFQAAYPRPPSRDTAVACAILDSRVVHQRDLASDPDVPPLFRELSQQLGFRSALVVPMLREGEPIGAIGVARRGLRTGARPFSPAEIDLLQTFADQAVIAIENMRLFTESQEKNRALTESLEQQTATADILQVISRSPTEVEPVFEAVVTNAARLCEAHDVAMLLVDGDDLRLVAGVGPLYMSIPPDFRIRLTRGSAATRAVVDRATVHIHDFAAESEEEYPVGRELARRFGHRSMLAVPLLREGVPIGVVCTFRLEVRPFPDQQIALLRTFADQAVIAIENVRLFKELQTRNRELTTALDRQTATADVLRIIAQSPTELQPVLDAIAASAVHLCAASDAVIERLEGDRFYNAAHAGAQMRGLVGLPLPLTRRFPGGRAVLDRQPIIIDDIQLIAEDEYPDVLELLKLNTVHSVAEIPLLSEGKPLGTIAVLRAEVRPFTDNEIALLKTFADQAVIAIENVRLFNETREALEQQTATADILHVISRSPTDVQPVFDTIVTRARALTDAHACGVFLLHGDVVSIAAHDSLTDEWRQEYPRVASANTVSGRAMLGRTTVHVTDLKTNPDYEGAPGRRVGIRTVLAAPMLREGQTIGAIVVWRSEVMSFSDKQIALLQTFADQAVIAIENVRLFTELQTSNRELTTALDAQTATSDILRVISRSQTDVRPVFDAIVNSAVRLLRARSGTLSRIVGDQIELAAHTSTDEAGDAATRVAFPQPLSFGGVHAQTIRNRAPLNIVDAQSDPRLPEATHTYARVRGYRSQGAVPILRQDEAIGALAVTRREPGGFTDDEIALLQTFADQAVIAIENARLLTELRARTQELTRSVEQLTALGEVGRAVSSTLDLETVLTTIVSRAVQLSGLDGGVVFEYDEDTEEFVHRAATETGGGLAEARRTTRIRTGEGVVGRTAVTLEPAQVPDITVPGVYESRLRENLIESGIRAILAVPMVRDDRLIGCLVVSRNAPGDFPAETIELLRTFATQSALAIQNARLFREIESKSRELEAASRHKSEFLANMSHELRTPLNAIIGFSEVLSERMFGDLNEKQDEYLKDIHASGQHLLSLINDILDLSKIEAGRMELELKDFDLPQAIGNAVTLVRERAGRRGIALHQAIDERLGQIRGDERKVKQVLLNLLSNALKFTPEGGRVDVRATLVNGMAEVSVTDTGVGIAPEDQEAVFEEFRQVGRADKKVEGTGLGLTLSRKFIELHGGRIRVKSEVGHGSTFTFTLPLTMDHRPEASGGAEFLRTRSMD